MVSNKEESFLPFRNHRYQDGEKTMYSQLAAWGWFPGNIYSLIMGDDVDDDAGDDKNDSDNPPSTPFQEKPLNLELFEQWS